MKQPRILVAGGHTENHQFVRNIQALGCQVDWINGDPSNTFPRFCDAAVIAKFQLSHEKFWQVKSAYSNKPVFIADHSWSTIKARFEEFVADWHLKNKPKTTLMEQAMKKAIYTTPSHYDRAIQVTTDKPKHTGIEQMKHQYTKEAKAIIDETVRADFKAGISPKDTLAKLTAKGMTLANGKPLSLPNVYVWRNKLGLYVNGPMAPKKSAHTEKAPAEVITTVPKASSSAPKKQDAATKLVYELILSANLPPTETTALMRRCMDGKLSQEECLKFIELYTDLKGGT